MSLVGSYNNAAMQDTIAKFVHGHGLDTRISYGFLTNPALYTKNASGIPNPERVYSIIGAIPVVSVVESATGAGAVSVTYTYEGARAEAGGRGFLGFASLTTRDVQTGIETTTTYHQHFPYIGMPKSTQQTLGGVVLSESSNVYQNYVLNQGASVFPFLARSHELSRRINSDGSATLMSEVVSEQHYEKVAERYARLTDVTVYTFDNVHQVMRRVHTANSYQSDNLSAWLLNRLSASTVTHEQGSGVIGATGLPSFNPNSDERVVRHSAFAYTAYGLLDYEVIEPQGDNESYLKTAYEYDGYGNQIRTTVCSLHYAGSCGGSGLQLNEGKRIYRQSETQFDASGRYVVARYENGELISTQSDFNALGQAQRVNHAGVVSVKRFNA
ncbi:hypothetical protein CWE08_10855, partial [Aliidiomarina iranensis]